VEAGPSVLPLAVRWSAVLPPGFRPGGGGLGRWWFALAVGVIVHLALLEFFRLAQFQRHPPADHKTHPVVCQLLLIATHGASGGGKWRRPGRCGRAGVRGGKSCAWLLLQARHRQTIADIGPPQIFGLFYLGFLPPLVAAA